MTKNEATSSCNELKLKHFETEPSPNGSLEAKKSRHSMYIRFWKLRLSLIISTTLVLILSLPFVSAECRPRNYLDVMGDENIVSIDQYHYAIDKK